MIEFMKNIDRLNEREQDWLLARLKQDKKILETSNCEECIQFIPDDRFRTHIVPYCDLKDEHMKSLEICKEFCEKDYY